MILVMRFAESERFSAGLPDLFGAGLCANGSLGKHQVEVAWSHEHEKSNGTRVKRQMLTKRSK